MSNPKYTSHRLSGLGVHHGKSYEEAFGADKAREIKHKMRLAKLGKKRPPRTWALKGERHWNWKGGTSRAYKTGYYSAEYKEWRKKVFERDSFTCQECGATGYVTAHHIKSFANYKELRYELANGVTLCEECHSKTDNYKGRNKGTALDK